MQILIVAPVINLTLEGSESFMIGDFMLTRNNDIINSLVLDQNFKARIGLNKMSRLMDSHIVYFNGESTSINFLKGITDISVIAECVSKFIQTAIDTLWFEKNNSVFVNQCFIVVGNEVYEANTYLYITDNIGTNKQYSFTRDEMVEALTLLPIFSKKYWSKSLKDEKQKSMVNSEQNVWNTSHRVPRALLFLQIIRKESNLVIKITFSVALLESLFSSSNQELSHQVSERVAIFLRDEKKERIEAYKKVKEAYGVRSSYIHGDKVNKHPDALLNLNIIMDDLIRSVFLKIFKNDDIFMMGATTKDYKTKFEDYFKELIFQ